MAHLSLDHLLPLLKKRMEFFDIHKSHYKSLGLDFLGRNFRGQHVLTNPLAINNPEIFDKPDLFDKERLLTGVDLPEILDAVKKLDFWDAVESLQRLYPLWDTQAIYHSTLCPFMLNLVQKELETHAGQSISWFTYIQMYKTTDLSLQPFIMSVIGCVENGSLPSQELQNLKQNLSHIPLDKSEQALASCIQNDTIDFSFIADSIIHNRLEILPVLFVLSASSASLVLRQLHQSGSPLPVYDPIDKFQRICYFALFQKIGLNWSQEQTPQFKKWLEDVEEEDQTLSKSSQTVTSFDDIFHGHRPIKTQGRCLFVEYQGRQMIMKIRYKNEPQHRFKGSAVLSEGKKHDNTGLFQRCDRIQKVTLSEDIRLQCERMIRKQLRRHGRGRTI